MRGRIVRFVSDRQFGFIAGTDDQEYFFHRSVWMEPEVPAKGDLVSFKPTNGDKGLRARNVQRMMEQVEPAMEHFQWVPLEKIQFTAESTPRQGEVFGEGVEIYAQNSDCSVNDMREELKKVAHSLGANAILNYRYTRKTGSSGNYHYTIHHVSGVPALVGVKAPSQTPGLEESSHAALMRCSEEMIKKVCAYAQDQKQGELFALIWKVMGWGFFLFVFFWFLTSL